MREKVQRGRMGAKAGLGVGAGREMFLLSALGSVRERRERGESLDLLRSRTELY